MITASALPRLLNCPGSAVLPKAELHSEFADAGHEEHAELAKQVLAGDLPDAVARFCPASPRVEVKVAYDVATGVGRVLGEGVDDRRYGDLAAFEIPGSIDVLGIEGDAVVVLDFKTGFRDVDPAATNAQLRFYALAACRALRKERAVIRIVYTQRGTCDEAEMDALDLADFASTLAALPGRVAALKQQQTVDTREGSWCRYCPANKAACPSKSALLVQIGKGEIGQVLTPDLARVACEQVLAAEQIVSDAKKRLSAYVTEHGPIDRGDGKMYGRYVQPGRERVNADIALRAIVEICGDSAKEFSAEAIETKTTKAAMKRAAKAVGEPALEKRVLGRIRELGGMDKAPDSLPVGEYQADKYDAAPIDYEEVDRLLKESA